MFPLHSAGQACWLLPGGDGPGGPTQSPISAPNQAGTHPSARVAPSLCPTLHPHTRPSNKLLPWKEKRASPSDEPGGHSAVGQRGGRCGAAHAQLTLRFPRRRQRCGCRHRTPLPHVLLPRERRLQGSSGRAALPASLQRRSRPGPAAPAAPCDARMAPGGAAPSASRAACNSPGPRPRTPTALYKYVPWSRCHELWGEGGGKLPRICFLNRRRQKKSN